jgi:hypothetical protein
MVTVFDLRHAAVDTRMAELAREIREWEIKLLSARTREEKRIIRGEIGRLRATFLYHQDEPWPEDVERARQDASGR